MNKLKTLFTTLLFVSIYLASSAQVGTNGEDRQEDGRPVKEYTLVIEKNKATLAGVTAKGMTVNGSVPGPVLEFTEGDLAIINVTNKMDEETSVHWHGLILPNFYDGVPYLSTPPIEPGKTLQYRIPINQSGTYWYHSHTMLQEQKGVYGGIVIHPKKEDTSFDHELVVVLSDWTNEKPMNVLRNLKRGNEWYQLKKGTSVPLSRAIAEGGFGAQLKMWRDRMEGADIADIYYPTFIANGQGMAVYPNFKPGEKVRLRFINASASSYFWLDIGAGDPQLIASDGVDVEPVQKSRLLFAIAETYDFSVTIPEGTLEIIATAQDGSGHTAIHMGSGKLFPAQVIARPNKVAMMKQMAQMDMKMGAPALIGSKKRNTPEALKQKYGMHMQGGMNKGHGSMDGNDSSSMAKNNEMMHQQKMGNSSTFDHQARMQYFNYDFLRARDTTTFDPTIKVNELLLNLTGNMNRYVWSLNGRPLTEADKIRIKKGEITRIRLNNLTMMHHPMHLHGHYFRVINNNGERSPLKHTVNVPPMREVTIEFYNEEYGDWFFHCHVLYHMMGGMARVFSYNTERDNRLSDYPAQNLIDETDHYFYWGTAQLGSSFSELSLTAANIRNEFNLRAEGDYHQNAEIEVSYNRYLNDWVRLYAAVNTENESPDSYNDFNTVGLVGVKYFTPYMFNTDLSIDHQLRPRIRIDRELLLLPSLFLEGEYEYKADFGWVNSLDDGSDYEGESSWLLRLSYMVSRNFSLQGYYHNNFGWGGGLTVRF